MPFLATVAVSILLAAAIVVLVKVLFEHRRHKE